MVDLTEFWPKLEVEVTCRTRILLFRPADVQECLFEVILKSGQSMAYKTRTSKLYYISRVLINTLVTCLTVAPKILLERMACRDNMHTRRSPGISVALPYAGTRIFPNVLHYSAIFDCWKSCARRCGEIVVIMSIYDTFSPGKKECEIFLIDLSAND